MPPRSSLTPFQLHVAKWKNGCGAEECSRARKIVFARGKIPADVLFIGEAPGESEDVIGQPFKGVAGELLQRIIDDAIPEGIRWAMTNVVGCIPRDEDGLKSGEPCDEQIKSCQPRLYEFINLVNPKLLVLVGTVARDWLDPKYMHGLKLGREIPMVDIKHPAAILRETVASRGLSIQRSIVVISNAVSEYVGN